ncbi:hypothetical protein BH09PLA1_BH09PLA1_33740 [soil metagenome]
MTRLAKKVLLIGWDSADWKMINPLVDAGRMPTLSKLIDSGCIGNLATLQPCLSPILWTSIATGKTADAHGVCGFVEPLPDGTGVKLVGSTTRKTKAIWNILTQRELKTHIVSWYASHPAEPIGGVCVSDQFCNFDQIDAANNRWPMLGDAVHPPDLAQSIAALRVRPPEIRAADILPFIPKLAEIDLHADARPGKLASVLASCASTHAVATAVLQQEPWDFLAVYYDTLDRAGHEFMPYHPPRMANVAERDFELYSGVMNGLYQFHDMLLARLLQLAGDDVTVLILSDHGFHSDHLRPMVPASTQDVQAAQWHRHFGMLAMRGPGIVADERVYGASLLDIAPTVLALFGLPIGADMPGKPLVQAFDRSVQLERIPSWDAEPGNSGMHPPEKRDDAFASAAAMQQLIDLGYLAPTASDVASQVAQAAREAQFNLATVHSTSGRPTQAMPLLRALVEQYPDEPRYQMSLAQSLLDSANPQEARQILESFEVRQRQRGDGHDADLSDSSLDTMIGQCLLATGDNEAALARLLRAERGGPDQPTLLCVLGGAYYALGKFEDARRVYDRAVAIDRDSVAARFGLARTLISLREFEAAVEQALQTVGLVHQFPAAHFALGLALEQLGQMDRAIRAMQTAVEMAPNFPEAHARLATIFMQRGEVQIAMNHRRQAEGHSKPA